MHIRSLMGARRAQNCSIYSCLNQSISCLQITRTSQKKSYYTILRDFSSFQRIEEKSAKKTTRTPPPPLPLPRSYPTAPQITSPWIQLAPSPPCRGTSKSSPRARNKSRSPSKAIRRISPTLVSKHTRVYICLGHRAQPARQLTVIARHNRHQ